MFCLGVIAEGGARGMGQWQAGWSPRARAVSKHVSDICEPQHSVAPLALQTHTGIFLMGFPVMG